MDGVGNYAGWRWIFILEGILTVLVGVVAPFTMYDFPETASFLTDAEREYVIHALRTQTSGEARQEVVEEEAKFRTKYVVDAMTDWQIYIGLFSMFPPCSFFSVFCSSEPNLMASVYWGITCPLYGISFFLPSIIKDLGYTSSTAQLLTVPIYITAAVVAVGGAWLSDRYKKRSPFILFFMSLIAIGFIIVLASSDRGVPGVVYFGVFVAVVGASTFQLSPSCHVADRIRYIPCLPRKHHLDQRQPRRRLQTRGRDGNAYRVGESCWRYAFTPSPFEASANKLRIAMASNFYREQDAPKYTLGHALELGFCVVGIGAVLVLRQAYKQVNRKREQMDVSNYASYEMAKMGDRSPMFRYML